MHGLYRTDDERPDGVTMISWEMSKHRLWDVTVVDALAPSRSNQGFHATREPLKRVKLRSIANY